MPNRRKPKRKPKRRQRKSTMLVRGPNITPDAIMVKLPYHQNITLNGTGGAFTEHLFRGNSIFDPDLSGAGGQPLGNDQWSAFYNKYLVLASKITVRAVTVPTPTRGGQLVIAPFDLVGGASGIEQAAEQPYAKDRVVSAFQNKEVVMSSYLTTKKKFGYTKVEQLNILAAIVGTSPAEEYYWSVSLAALDGLGTIIMDVNVEVEYYVKFFDRNALARS